MQVQNTAPILSESTSAAQPLAEFYARLVRPQEECAVAAVLGSMHSARKVVALLQALQHRGYESSGVLLHDPLPGVNQEVFELIRGVGLVSQVYSGNRLIEQPQYPFAMGHNRYSTSGSKDDTLRNTQPLKARIGGIGEVSLAHNGNLANAAVLRERLKDAGCLFQTGTDTELILHLLAQKYREFQETPGPSAVPHPRELLEAALSEVVGSYSLLVMMDGKFFAIRDPNGFRPLVMGRDEAGMLAFASETCALQAIGVPFLRELKPGEMLQVELNGNGTVGVPKSFQMRIDALPTTGPGEAAPLRSFCSFESAYFADPSSVFDGRLVLDVREEFGRATAESITGLLSLENAVIVPVPDSGTFAGDGFAKAMQRYPTRALLRNQYSSRSFLQKDDAARREVARTKRRLVGELVAGRDVILVDDSLVRGNTTRALVEDLKAAGARSVTLVVCAPPIVEPCHYGIDMPSRDKLIASKYTIEQMKAELGLAGLHFIPLKTFKRILGPGHCFACMDGNFPTAIPQS